MHLFRVGNDVGSHCNRDRDRDTSLALDFLLNGNRENLERHLTSIGLLVSKSESAALLPRPVGVVEDFDFSNLSAPRSQFKCILGLALDDGTSVLPSLLAFEIPAALTARTLSRVLLVVLVLLAEMLAKLTHLLAKFFSVKFAFAIVAKAAHELVEHVLEAATATTAATTTSTTTTTATAAAMLAHHLLEESHRVVRSGLRCLLLLFLSRLGLLLVKHSDHDIRGATRLGDLQHRVLLLETILALSAQVVVLANSALVADANDRSDAASIAGDVLMDGLGLFSGHVGGRELFGLKQFFKRALSLLLKLLVDQIFESLARDTLNLVLLLLTLLSRKLLVTHLFVIFVLGLFGAL